MKETLELGTTSPLDAPCVQVCQDRDYMSMMRREGRVFKSMLERLAEAGTFGEQGNAYFRIASNPHDFGSYLDVEIVWSDTDEVGEAFAYAVESGIPEDWDDAARAELGIEYFEYLDKEYGFDESN